MDFSHKHCLVGFLNCSCEHECESIGRNPPSRKIPCSKLCPKLCSKLCPNPVPEPVLKPVPDPVLDLVLKQKYFL